MCHEKRLKIRFDLLHFCFRFCIYLEKEKFSTRFLVFLCMSSLNISILFSLLTIIIANSKTSFYFTQSIYELWCQENTLSNSLFLYPNVKPIGIYRTSNIQSITYYLINDINNGLFEIKVKYLADFYFLIINITRPLDINREDQAIYQLHIQAHIITKQENFTEQTEVRILI